MKAAEGVVARIQLPGELPILVDMETSSRAWRATLVLAQTQGLTSYDAAYLGLAERTRLPLMSKDEALIRVAQRRRVPVLPKRSLRGR